MNLIFIYEFELVLEILISFSPMIFRRVRGGSADWRSVEYT